MSERATDHYPVQSECDVNCAFCGWYNHEPQGRSWWDHLPDSLDAAWAEAEAALPEGWLPFSVEPVMHPIHAHDKRTDVEYDAVTQSRRRWAGDGHDDELLIGTGPTPAAALRALAARLREARG